MRLEKSRLFTRPRIGGALIGALAVGGAFTLATLHARQLNSSYFGDLHWRNIGPPRSGYISSPAGVPGDPTTYYAGTPEGGVWKSTNGGVTWKPIFDSVHVASIGAVAVAPSDHNVVYAGTGNQSSWSFTTGKGVYRSADAGHTWTNVGLPNSQYIGGMVVDPRDANHVLVAAMGAGGGRGARAGGAGAAPAQPTAPPEVGERGVYRTTDGGKTWTRVVGDGTTGATDVWLDFGDPQICYALLQVGGTGGFAGAPAVQGQPPTGNTGIYKSTDGGATGKPIAGKGLGESGRIAAFSVASGTHGQRLYAVAGAAARNAGGRGLYRSDDGGENWTLGTRQLASAGGKIYADPQRPDVVYLAGTAIYRSTDAGAHVAAFWGAPSGADPRFMWIDPTNWKRMMMGVDQGPSVSVDGGESFSPYYGMVDGQFYRVATDYDTPYHVCGPQQDSGTACVASRTDFGEIRPSDWYPGGGFENGFLIADPLDKRYLYTQGWYHVLRRYDKTTAQDVVLYQPTATDRFGGAPPLAFSPQDPHTLYMAAQYVMASHDRGLTWKTISPDLLAVPKGPAPATAPGERVTGVGAPAVGGSIQSMAVSPVTAGVIWAGTSNGLIHVTRDAGLTWKNVTPPNLPPSGINIIDAGHKSAGTAYAAVLSRDAHPHIYRTADFGATWKEISSGLDDGAAVRVVREDPIDPNLLYAGTVTAAYVSFDKGDHWQSLQLNLPTTVVSDMTVKNDDLVISTYGRGFWILDDVTPLRQIRTAMASQAPAFLFKPQPAQRMRWDNTQDTPVPPEMKVGDNPIEGATLDYYLPQAASGTVTLTITDALGKTIREYSSIAPPPDTTMPNIPEYWLMPIPVLPTSAGMHRVNWDLRYPDPPTLNYGYSGNLLDYREYTLNWHALPGQTPRTTLVGPMVVPGTYRAKLTVNGQSVTQPITVVADPRLQISQLALEAQFHQEQRMVAGIKATLEGFNYIQSVRDALAKGTPNATLDAALAQIQSGPAGLGIAHRDLGRRLNDQLIDDMAPTPSIVAGVDAPCKSIDLSLDALRKLQAANPSMPKWTPPAAPACGR